MADNHPMKHNPSFLNEADLAVFFVVRETELRLLLRIIRENTGPVNQHVIIIGPRGMGKTMLVLRLAQAVRLDQDLNKTWYPVTLPEDVYDVATEGELWLRALQRIAFQEKNENRWQERFDTLRSERDERRLRSLTLAALSEFSAERHCQLIIIVENLQILLGEQSAGDQAWNLRQTLLNNPEIMLIATATTHFREIQDINEANFELFREIKLEPLSTDDCRVLWKRITNENLLDGRIRPMEILTGGSPRLLTILADFAVGRSLSELMDDLIVLIDDHTTYFKANVESLPLQERRVFVTLAEIWEPAESRQVAQNCRLEVNKTSAYLKKLLEKGAVSEVGKIGRKNLYQVTERLYNIYHLMRLSSGESDRVKALVRFMTPFYGEERMARALIEEASRTEGPLRLKWIVGYKDLVFNIANDYAKLDGIFKATPIDFLEHDDFKKIVLNEIPTVFISEAKSTLDMINNALYYLSIGENDKASSVLNDLAFKVDVGISYIEMVIYVSLALDIGNKYYNMGKLDKAIDKYNEVIARVDNTEDSKLYLIAINALIRKGLAFDKLRQFNEMTDAYNKVITLYGHLTDYKIKTTVASVLNSIGVCLADNNNTTKALEAFNDVINHFGSCKETEAMENVAMAIIGRGLCFALLHRYDEAILENDEVINRFGMCDKIEIVEKCAIALINKGICLGRQVKYMAELETYDELIKRLEKYSDLPLRKQMATSFLYKGRCLKGMARHAEAIETFNNIVLRFKNFNEPELMKQVAEAQVEKAKCLEETNRYDEAVIIYNDIVSQFGEHSNHDILKEVAKALNNRANIIYIYRDITKLDSAIQDIKQALSILPQNKDFSQTFIRLLSMASRWEEAFKIAREFINDESLINIYAEDVIEFFIEAAAAGKAEETLKVIKGTKAAKAMEPLVVALKMSAGKPYRAPREVVEVAKDIIKRIEKRKQERATAH